MAVGRSIKRERQARALLAFVVIILISGTFFFMEVEHWNPVDSLYYCVTTLTTVGSGELRPHTDMGKIFTVMYLFMGVGAVLATLQLISRHAIKQDEDTTIHKIRAKLEKKRADKS